MLSDKASFGTAGLITNVYMNNSVQQGFIVRGRVQGVGYRFWVARLAREHGMAGTAQNTADGAVEVHVYGPATDMPQFEARLLEGPFWANVASVTRTESDQDLSVEFRILQ